MKSHKNVDMFLINILNSILPRTYFEYQHNHHKSSSFIFFFLIINLLNQLFTEPLRLQVDRL